MSKSQKAKSIHGFIFACTDKTEKECYDRSLFGAITPYGPVVIRIKKGDILFLHNLSSDELHGVFRAVTDGGFDLEHQAWGGKYPYQVRMETLGGKITLGDSKRLQSRFKIKRNAPLIGKNLIDLLELFASELPEGSLDKYTDESRRNQNNRDAVKQIAREMDKIKRATDFADVAKEIPLIEATTWWDFPKQSYGLTAKGDNKYPGVTPALIIYNLLWRYTNPGDLVLDPMCGSGTTIDVCIEERRSVIGYDIEPCRPDIIQNDAKKIPLDDSSVDMIFIDSPYGDNIRYNDHPDDIGKISSETDLFYDELEKVMMESCRVLKEGKVLGWLIGDQWVKDKFTPVGFRVFNSLCKYFDPVDIICVSRRGQSSNTAIWYKRARRLNFYLRGFKHLFIMRKPFGEDSPDKRPKVQWRMYKRGEANNE